MTNAGVAPIYFEAFPTVNGVRSQTSLKGLLPGQARQFTIAAGGTDPALTIESDRLVPGAAHRVRGGLGRRCLPVLPKGSPRPSADAR